MKRREKETDVHTHARLKNIAYFVSIPVCTEEEKEGLFLVNFLKIKKP